VVAKVIRLQPDNFALAEDGILAAATPAHGPETHGWEPARFSASARRGGAATGGLAPLPIRSVERRRWSADLTDTETAGLVLHGIGGIGKSVLAADISARIGRLEPERMTTVVSGEVSADGFLAALATAARRHPVASVWSDIRSEAVAAAGRVDLPADYRLALLHEHVLGRIPVLLVLDGFDDNLAPDGGGWQVRDPALGGLLARWADGPQRGRLLITCRQPFSLPGGAERGLGFRRLGPLSRDGAGELAGSLRSLRLLAAHELDQAWRLLGGHPRALEYLEALLADGRVSFAGVAGRLAAAIEARTGEAALGADPPSPATLPPAAAETTALAACDLLLGELRLRLSASAENLLIGTSVYRAPIGCTRSLLPGGELHESVELAELAAECEALGLLTADRGSAPPAVFVHRWTACELHRQLTEGRRGDEVTEAHRRAAGYWQRRVTASPQDGRALLEAAHHLHHVGYQAPRDQPAGRRPMSPARRRRLFGLATAGVSVAVVLAVVLSVFLTAQATRHQPGPRITVTHIGAPPGSTRSGQIRRQTAAWVARQVSKAAVVACDPAMCSALQAQGIEQGNLVVLRTASFDPLGSDVVIATAAVRSEFGGRLAGVYAPAVLASFGTGGTRIDVRAVAAYGAAAYRAALAADLAARSHAGGQLLRNPRISVTPAARHELRSGQADPRLLIMLAALATTEPVHITVFTDSGPGASAGMPLRAVTLAAMPGRGGIGGLRGIRAFARAQRQPFLPARAAITRGGTGTPVLTVEFPAPSPVGLLKTQPHNPAGGPAATQQAQP
jgi:hypothetical protein